MRVRVSFLLLLRWSPALPFYVARFFSRLGETSFYFHCLSSSVVKTFCYSSLFFQEGCCNDSIGWLAGGFSSLLPVHLHEKGYGGNSVLLYLSVGWSSLAIGCGMGMASPCGGREWDACVDVSFPGEDGCCRRSAGVGEQWIVVCDCWGECRGGMLWLEEAQDQEL